MAPARLAHQADPEGWAVAAPACRGARAAWGAAHRPGCPEASRLGSDYHPASQELEALVHELKDFWQRLRGKLKGSNGNDWCTTQDHIHRLLDLVLVQMFSKTFCVATLGTQECDLTKCCWLLHLRANKKLPGRRGRVSNHIKSIDFGSPHV